MELCGHLGLCSSASVVPLHTLLAQKVTHVLSTPGVSRDLPRSLKYKCWEHGAVFCLFFFP